MFFFFFKQKTAYDMRISDWSSDVCSSDLVPLLAIAVEPSDALRQAHGIPRQVVIDQDVAAAMQVDAFAARLRGYEELAVLLEKQIGRASCRERVCQYV